MASLARGNRLGTFTEKIVGYFHLVVAAAGYHPFQPVHLPHIPRNDIGNVVDRLTQRVMAELCAVILNKGIEHRLAGQQQAIALPLVGVYALVGFLRGFQPLACGDGVFSHYAQLAVEQAYALAKRNEHPCGGIVAADDVGCLAAGDFKTGIAHVILPRFPFGKGYLALGCFPSVRTVFSRIFHIEHTFAAKPRLINEVVLRIAHPRGGEHLGHAAHSRRLRILVFQHTWHYHLPFLASDKLGQYRVVVAVTVAKVLVIMCSPKDIAHGIAPARRMVFEQSGQQLRRGTEDVVLQYVGYIGHNQSRIISWEEMHAD